MPFWPFSWKTAVYKSPRKQQHYIYLFFDFGSYIKIWFGYISIFNIFYLFIQCLKCQSNWHAFPIFNRNTFRRIWRVLFSHLLCKSENLFIAWLKFRNICLPDIINLQHPYPNVFLKISTKFLHDNINSESPSGRPGR